MINVMESELGPLNFELRENISMVLIRDESDDLDQFDPDYQQFLADVWVGIVLTLMVLSCVCCMCSCLLYHKFQQWKLSVAESRPGSNLEAGPTTPEVDLPSYTIASGLPTYQEALEQLKQIKALSQQVYHTTNQIPPKPPN